MTRKKHKTKKKRKKRILFRCPVCEDAQVGIKRWADEEEKTVRAITVCPGCYSEHKFSYPSYYGAKLELEKFDIYGDFLDKVAEEKKEHVEVNCIIVEKEKETKQQKRLKKLLRDYS